MLLLHTFIGRDWVTGFRKRHKKALTLRKKEKLSYRRANGLTRWNKDQYFGMLERLINEHNIQPEDIWNADEAGFQADSAEQTVW